MSGDRETNHDMTYDEAHADIALLLADAADEVEVGAAPYQAVVRGGRRRKTRRWAVAAVAAAVIAGSTGTTLALVVLHVSAALYNQFGSPTNVADRMPPFRATSREA